MITTESGEKPTELGEAPGEATSDLKRFIEATTVINSRPTDDAALDAAIDEKILLMDSYETIAPLRQRETTLNTRPRILVTMTTCKRLVEFLTTMKSFDASVVDPELIGGYFCVDDNSSESDREVMRREYPRFDYVWKTPDQKGHVESMKIIAREVARRGYDYVLHLEDDWMFVNELRLADALEIMADNTVVRQVALNKNYAERRQPSAIDRAGGISVRTKRGLRYYVHEYCDTKQKRDSFTSRWGSRRHCNYWPHFTLQPSVVDARVFKDVTFKTCRHFEMVFAFEYADSGYKTAFYQEPVCVHIGRLISEAGTGKLNAYQLNETCQF